MDEKLLTHCKADPRRFTLASIYSGARFAGIFGAVWKNDAVRIRRIVAFRRTKTGKIRAVHIPDRLPEEVRRFQR